MDSQMNPFLCLKALGDTQRGRPEHVGVRQLACAVALTVLVGCGGGGTADSMAKIQQQIDAGKFAEAVVGLKSVLQQSPNTAQARLMLGRLHLISGDALGAEAELRRALNAGAARDEVVPPLARAMLDAGRLAALLDEFSSYEPTSDKAWVELKSCLAEAMARSGKIDGAKGLVAQVLKRQPEHAGTLLLQARLTAGAGDADGALRLVDSVLQRDAKSLDAMRLKADVTLFSKQDIPGAVALYTALVQLSPNRVDSRTALITALLLGRNVDTAATQIAELKKLAPQNLQTRSFEAHLAHIKKDYVQTRDIAYLLLKIAPNNAGLMELAGSAELNLGSWQKAEALLGKAVFAAPQRKVARQLLARSLLLGGRPEKALEVLRPLMEAGRPDTETQIIAGEAFVLMAQPDKAHALFVQASKQRPDDDRLKTTLVLIDRSNNSFDKAVSALGAIATGSEDTAADMALFSLLMQRRDFDGAQAAVDRLDKKRPNSPIPMYLQAQVHGGKGNVTAMRSSFEAALKRSPGFFSAVAGIAFLDLRNGQAEDAWKRIDAYAVAEPSNEQGWLALVGIASHFPDAAKRQKQVIERGLVAVPGNPELGVLKVDMQLKDRQVTAALATAQALRAAHGQRADVLDVLGRAQLAAGDIRQAQRSYADMVLLAPKSTLALMRQAEVLRLAGDLSGALRSARKAAELVPAADMGVMTTFIALAVQAKQPEPVLQVIRAQRQRVPDDAMSYLFEGDLLMALTQTNAALTAYRTGTNLAKNANRAAVRLHAHLVRLKREPEAQEFAQVWLRKWPKDLVFLGHLGEVALHTRRYAEAETQFRAVLAVAPANASALNNTAWALLKQGKPGAQNMAREAVKLEPANHGFRDTLALSLGESGAPDDLKQALEMQTQLVERLPQVPAYRLHLSQLLLKAGKREQARPHLDILAKLGRGFTEHEEVVRLQGKL